MVFIKAYFSLSFYFVSFSILHEEVQYRIKEEKKLSKLLKIFYRITYGLMGNSNVSGTFK
jgi:hypothetical protein